MAFSFSFPLEGGLHVWPATVLRQRALQHRAPTEFLNERTGRRASLRNVLSLLATETHWGDPCRILAEGEGAEEALQDLEAFLHTAFLACDSRSDAGSAGQAGLRSTVILRLLARHEARWWAGTSVSPGVGEGTVAFMRTAPAGPRWLGQRTRHPEAEVRELHRALDRLLARLKEEEAQAANAAQQTVLEAHGALLQDEGWTGNMGACILRDRLAAPAAVAQATRTAVEALRQSESPYIRARAVDLQDLADRLIDELLGEEHRTPDLVLRQPTVVVANDLTPSRFLALDRSRLKGLILAEGSPASHTAILARAFGIPCAAGFQEVSIGLLDGQRVLVDGKRGLVIADPPAEVQAYYRIETEGRQARTARLARAASGPAATGDGLPVTVRANIAIPDEAALAATEGADGIGLFRTEMLFLHRPAPPTEEEQLEAYLETLGHARGAPVVLRLLDVGGDKPLPYLAQPTEANPFLGRRGVRWYPEHAELVVLQLRAALRAALGGDLRLMIPMVSDVEEVRYVRSLLAKAEAQLAAEGLPCRAGLPLGAMVEVPAAVMNVEALARETDFLCVGTNDLIPYLFAMDRAGVPDSRNWHPATLRLLDRILQGARTAGIPVSLCGEMAARPQLLPLLVGLGFEELSVAPTALAETKYALAGIQAGHCRPMVQEMLKAATAREVLDLLETEEGSRDTRSLLEEELLVLDASCASKEEAIRLLVERFYITNRSQDPTGLEAAIWAREDVYPTGIGHGFAVPHCTSSCVSASSLAVLRLREPVDWGALDDPEIRFIFLLVGRSRAGSEHLRLFARLARRLMDPLFRQRLLEAADVPALLGFLHDEMLQAH